MLRRCLLLSLLAVLALPTAAMAQSPSANAAQADGLLTKTLYKGGASGRYLMGGSGNTAPTRRQRRRVGLARQPRQRGLDAGHASRTPGTPRTSATRRSPAASAGIARASTFPSAAKRLSWVVRFESVNYRSKVYLNGQLIGRTPAPTCRSRSACPPGCSCAAARTCSAIRVDNRRFPTDFPPSGLSDDRRADRRLVELRRPVARGLPAQDRPRRLQHRRGAARTCRAAAATPTCRTGRRCATRRQGAAGARHRAPGRAQDRDLGTASVGAKKFATLPSASPSRTRRRGRRRARISTTRP